MHAGVNPLTLTAMDSGFMFTYAGGSFITGQLGDRFSPVVVVGLGLLGSTICLLLIVFGASTSIISNVALCGTWFLTCQLLHGAFQATGGPVRYFTYDVIYKMLTCNVSLEKVNTAIMGNWFPAKGRGLIFGILLTSNQWKPKISLSLHFQDCGLAINTSATLPQHWLRVIYFMRATTGAGVLYSLLLSTASGPS